MRSYSFLNCSKVTRGGDVHIVAGERLTYRMSARFGRILTRLRGTYAAVFPNAAALRVGVVVEAHNGASGVWSIAESAAVGPIFLIEVDPALDGDEVTFAHELTHPTIRLLGVPTGRSLGEIDTRIGDEFTSTSHHPLLYDILDDAGYSTPQRAACAASADSELDRLSGADFSSPTFTSPPGQTWLALWYFNFYLLAGPQYDAIYERHRMAAPGVAERMNLVRECWLAATRNRGVIKRAAGPQATRAFQSELFSRLELKGRIELQSLESWAAWLFQAI